MQKKPVVLCILDGWGIGDGGEYDGIASASTPHWDAISTQNPNTTLITYGEDVGLPKGQMGNSEVGHMNIGAGRVVKQFLPRITEAFGDNSIRDNVYLKDMMAQLKVTDGVCHLMGLVSDGGVHADIKHIKQMASILSENDIPVKIHAFTDGRDTSPQSAKEFISELESHCTALDDVEIVTVSGRYFAMDRDKRWNRVQKAFNAVALGQADCTANNAIDAVQASYDANVTDEFIKPTVIGSYEGMKEGDGILFANFRSDRARELLQSFVFKVFDEFNRGAYSAEDRLALGMVPYSDELDEYMQALFPPLAIKNNLGEVLEESGLKQIRMAETEKYPHVTFFFNSGNETPSAHEDRALSNSPKVATYDLQPEMSAADVTANMMKALDSGDYDAIIVNYANPDMVGHTGDIEAVRKACEAVDKALGQIVPKVQDLGGAMIITADHGNADQMWDASTNGPHTAHTLNPVPFVIVGAGNVTLKPGCLADIAPTMLSLLGVTPPKDMTGQNLIKA